MKNIIILILSLIFSSSYSQEIKCLSPELYHSETDAINLNNSFDVKTELSEIDLKDNTLQLIVLNGSIAEFPKWSSHNRNGVNYGYKILLVNNSSSEFRLSNTYGKVVITRQAFFNNKWKNIKSFRDTKRAYCGNGLHRKVVMKPKDKYTFIAPCLEGNIKTKFRFVIFASSSNKGKTIFSNEFDGYINKNLIE